VSGGVLRDAIDGVENSVLHRVGVLELVDQRGRELATNDLREARSIGPVQSGVEAGQEVVEAHLRAPRLLDRKTFGDPARGMAEQLFARTGECRELGSEHRDGLESRVLRRLAKLPGFAQASRSQAIPSALQIGPYHRRVVAPIAQRLQPRLVVARLQFAPIHLLAGDRLVEQRLQVLDPLPPGRLELGQALPLLAESLRDGSGWRQRRFRRASPRSRLGREDWPATLPGQTTIAELRQPPRHRARP
jgi:hypothetical protein